MFDRNIYLKCQMCTCFFHGIGHRKKVTITHENKIIMKQQQQQKTTNKKWLTIKSCSKVNIHCIVSNPKKQQIESTWRKKNPSYSHRRSFRICLSMFSSVDEKKTPTEQAAQGIHERDKGKKVNELEYSSFSWQSCILSMQCIPHIYTFWVY